MPTTLLIDLPIAGDIHRFNQGKNCLNHVVQVEDNRTVVSYFDVDALLEVHSS